MTRNNCYMELKTLMFSRHINLSDLSENSKIKYATLSKKMTGVNDFTLTECYQILNALNLPNEDLTRYFPNDYKGVTKKVDSPNA